MFVCLFVCEFVWVFTCVSLFVVQTKHQFVCLWSCNRVHCEVFCLLFPVLLCRSVFFPVCFYLLPGRCYHDNHKSRVYFMHVWDEKLQHVWVELWNTFSDVLLSSNTSANICSWEGQWAQTPQTAPQTMLTEERKSSSCFHHWPDSDSDWYPLCDPLCDPRCGWPTVCDGFLDLLQAQGQPQIGLKQRPCEQLFACCCCFLSVWFVLVKIKKTPIIDYQWSAAHLITDNLLSQIFNELLCGFHLQTLSENKLQVFTVDRSIAE